MNTIKTYKSGIYDFLYDMISGIEFNNAPQAQSKNNQKLSPIVNTHSVNTNSSTSETDKNSYQSDSGNDPTNEPKNNSVIRSGKASVLSQAEIQLLEELKKIDTEVRQHEMAHIATGGKYITSGANFTYQRGPDGKNYAVGGEVGIDTSPVPGDPEATVRKMRQVKRAALAPADPSSQDLKIAANATSEISNALSELMISQVKDQATANEKKVLGNLKKATDSYEKVSSMPEKEPSSFRIAI